MLVLRRKVGEEIVIAVGGEKVIVRIADAGTGDSPGQQWAVLGVSAPEYVTIHRREVWEKIRHEKTKPADAR